MNDETWIGVLESLNEKDILRFFIQHDYSQRSALIHILKISD
jgi:hypothetical protein